jgi:hypothetical protein
MMIFSFPLLMFGCGGTSVDQENDHGDMMEDNEVMDEDHDEAMDDGMLSDTLDHEMNHEVEEGEMMDEEEEVF